MTFCCYCFKPISSLDGIQSHLAYWEKECADFLLSYSSGDMDEVEDASRLSKCPFVGSNRSVANHSFFLNATQSCNICSRRVEGFNPLIFAHMHSYSSARGSISLNSNELPVSISAQPLFCATPVQVSNPSLPRPKAQLDDSRIISVSFHPGDACTTTRSTSSNPKFQYSTSKLSPKMPVPCFNVDIDGNVDAYKRALEGFRSPLSSFNVTVMCKEEVSNSMLNSDLPVAEPLKVVTRKDCRHKKRQVVRKVEENMRIRTPCFNRLSKFFISPPLSSLIRKRALKVNRKRLSAGESNSTALSIASSVSSVDESLIEAVARKLDPKQHVKSIGSTASPIRCSTGVSAEHVLEMDVKAEPKTPQNQKVLPIHDENSLLEHSKTPLHFQCQLCGVTLRSITEQRNHLFSFHKVFKNSVLNDLVTFSKITL